MKNTLVLQVEFIQGSKILYSRCGLTVGNELSCILRHYVFVSMYVPKKIPVSLYTDTSTKPFQENYYC